MITEQNRIECRNVQINLLDELYKICTKHNLVFWIDFGTLLGAKRNGKFIPWDDDIDVSMPMRDYKKFIQIAEKELPQNIFLQTNKTDPNYRQYFAKLRDNNSTFIEHHETEEDKYHHGIYIDIFPSVYYPKMPYKLRKLFLYFIVRSRYDLFVKRKNVVLNFIKYTVFKTLFAFFKPFKSNEVAQTPEDNGYYYSIPDTLIYPLGKINFEGKEYPAPKDVHNYLVKMYGQNYMTPPPEKDRVSHARIILTNTPYKNAKY